MPRILFFIFLAFLVWLAVRVLGGSRKREDGPRPSQPSGSVPKIETISQCAWCGVHVPQGDAVTVPDGRLYCSEAHRDAARSAAPVDGRR